MNLVIYIVSALFAGLFGMVSVLITRSHKERKEGYRERAENETLLHAAKEVASKALYGVKDTVSGQKKETIIAHVSRFDIVRKHVKPRTQKLQDALHGRTKVVQEASSLYLQDIKNHKQNAQKRLQGTHESLLD